MSATFKMAGTFRKAYQVFRCQWPSLVPSSSTLTPHCLLNETKETGYPCIIRKRSKSKKPYLRVLTPVYLLYGAPPRDAAPIGDLVGEVLGDFTLQFLVACPLFPQLPHTVFLFSWTLFTQQFSPNWKLLLPKNQFATPSSWNQTATTKPLGPCANFSTFRIR